MCFLNNQVVEREREEGRERELKIEERGDIYVKRYEGEMSRERHRNGGGGDRNRERNRERNEDMETYKWRETWRKEER
jgi:hypothetical protein